MQVLWWPVMILLRVGSLLDVRVVMLEAFQCKECFIMHNLADWTSKCVTLPFFFVQPWSALYVARQHHTEYPHKRG